MRELLLYTTAGCHLCERAEDLLVPVIAFLNRKNADNSNHQIVISTVDIADSPALVEAYGLRIPVIRFEGGSAELGWPFDQAQIFEFIVNCQ